MKQVIVFPRGQLSAKDKEKLSKAGWIAVEADDPSKVVSVVPGASTISPDDLLCAALDALTNTPAYGSPTTRFAEQLAKRVLGREKHSAPQGESDK
jgi:hypothetical protein